MPRPASVDPLDRLRAIAAQLAQLDTQREQLAAERDALLAQHRATYRTEVLLQAAQVSRSHLYRVAPPLRDTQA
jgi:hypothetical protein